MADMNNVITEPTRLVLACYGQPTLNKKYVTRHSYGQLFKVCNCSKTMPVLTSLTATKEAFENIKHAHLQTCTW